MNGYRIELGEIESKSLEFGVFECCAVASNGFISLHYCASEEIMDDDLKHYIAKSLPVHYRIKLCRHRLLPRTPNGKLDYNAMKNSNEFN